MKIMFGAVMAFALVSVSLAQGPGGPGGQAGPGGGRGGARPPEVVAPSIPIDLALAATKAAVAACPGFQFGVAVLDQSGQPKLIYNMDGASGSHGTRAAGKASAALLINAPSEGLNDRAKADPAIAEKVQAAKDKGMPMMAMSGGLPIVSPSGQPMGAIGVSGAEPGGHDPECVAAAMKVIQAQLK